MEKRIRYYYIGFNANNAICNETFFDGSITLYPNKEKGNIYFSDTYIKDTQSDRFLNEYKQYIYSQVRDILNVYPETRFLCFNDKIKKMCKSIKNISIIQDNKAEITDYLNDKYKAREYVKDICPILDYMWIKGSQLDYKNISNLLNNTEFVVQAIRGAGGDNTFLVKTENELKDLIKDFDTLYCVSKYLPDYSFNTNCASSTSIKIIQFSKHKL